MPDYVPIQDLTIVGSVGDNDMFPLSDGSGAYAVRGSTIKSWATSDAVAAAAYAAASKIEAQNAATAAGEAQQGTSLGRQFVLWKSWVQRQKISVQLSAPQSADAALKRTAMCRKH